MRQVYLDYNATTPLDPRVLEAMMPCLTSEFGNPASDRHVFGRRAEAAVEKARDQVASFLGARAGEILFTSGSTESCNLALKGVAFRPIGAGPLLRRNLLIYGVGGVIIPFIGIKAIDLAVNALHLV